MAYAEKHGRAYRARWHDAAGRLRSASGFLDRQTAEAYGQARERVIAQTADIILTRDPDGRVTIATAVSGGPSITLARHEWKALCEAVSALPAEGAG